MGCIIPKLLLVADERRKGAALVMIDNGDEADDAGDNSDNSGGSNVEAL